MGRRGNFDVVRPHDSSSVFDTGVPKDVSPYQPRVAVSVEIQPRSLFKGGRLRRQLTQTNGAKYGQTALKSIFGGEENVITNYMAQRLLGIVEGSSSSDSRMNQSMQDVQMANAQYRDPVVTDSSGSTTNVPSSSSSSNESMGSGGNNPTPSELANLTDLSMGEMPLQITIPEPSESGYTGIGEMFSPQSASTEFESAQGSSDGEMEAIAEVETQPAEAAAQGGLLMPQETPAGSATVQPRDRGGNMMADRVAIQRQREEMERFNAERENEGILSTMQANIRRQQMAQAADQRARSTKGSYGFV